MKWQFSFVTLFAFITALGLADGRIIGGVEAPTEKHPEVGTYLYAGSSQCTAVVVGERVALAAGHCVVNGKVGILTVGGMEFEVAGVRSPVYPHVDHDLAVLISEEDFEVKPASINFEAVAKVGDRVRMFGFGCVDSAQPSQGELRTGIAKIDKVDELFISTVGNAICFGDSGAPAYLKGNKTKLVGIGSKGNIQDRSYFTSLQSNESQTFLRNVERKYDVLICGVGQKC